MSGMVLNIYKRELTTLTKAVEEFSQSSLLIDKGNEPIALLYSVKKCLFAKLEGAEFSFHPNFNRQKEFLDRCYEARIFTKNAELRWIAEPEKSEWNGTHLLGKAVILTELSIDQMTNWKRGHPWNVEDTIPGKYLLWGVKRNGDEAGWSELKEHRIGSLWVPIELTKKPGVQLEYVEYLVEDDGYGNLAVKAERLVGLKEYVYIEDKQKEVE